MSHMQMVQSVFSRSMAFIKDCAEKLLRKKGRNPCIPVSRHGLEESGVICPKCGQQAVEPGDWTRLHVLEKIERNKDGDITESWLEEAVCCWGCGSFLMASPDDDIDPVVQGEPYDRDIYHKFVRPENWKPPRQQTYDRTPTESEWVVIDPGVVALVTSAEAEEGQEQDLSNAEGRVMEIKDGQAKVKLGGMVLPGKEQYVEVPLNKIKPMKFICFKRGSLVKVIRGEYRGLNGYVQSWRHGDLIIKLKGINQPTQTQITIPQERVQLIQE